MDAFDVLVGKDITKWSRDEILKTFLKYEDGRVVFIKPNVASLYNTFLVGLYLELMKIVGKAAKGLVLRAARSGGIRAGSGIKRRYEKRAGKLSRDKAIQIARNMLTIWTRGFGWGDFEAEIKSNSIAVRLMESFEGDGYKKLKSEPSADAMCWMIFGYMWGLFEALLDAKITGEEKTCIAKGDECCLFEFELD
jgi:predicted hydrocarbon binding protein